MIFVVAHPLALVVMQSTLLQNVSSALRRVWYYLNTPVMIGNIPVSVTRLALGVSVLILTLIAARSFSSLLERRIEKRTHLDPGIRYTIARLAKYGLVSVGVLVALKQ